MIILDFADGIRTHYKHELLGHHHLLLSVCRLAGFLVEELACHVTHRELAAELESKLASGEAGTTGTRDEWVRRAAALARARSCPEIDKRELAATVLGCADYPLRVPAAPRLFPLPPPTRTGAGRRRPAASQRLQLPNARSPVRGPDSPAGMGRPKAFPQHGITALMRYGRDLVAAAARGELRPLVGRDDELDLVVETLCRQTKRNPAIIGPAGVGKTAIVEGLAIRIASGQVPPLLRDIGLFQLSVGALVAGASSYGVIEERMEQVLSEARTAEVALFVDEVHTLIGAGGREGTTDLASCLKPALARGDVACIAATTDDEWRRFVERDPALERRFEPIRVQEPSETTTAAILHSVRDQLRQDAGINVPDSVLSWIVSFTGKHMPDRHLPDKAIDLLERCVANAAVLAVDEVTHPRALHVAARVLGRPVLVEERLQALEDRLLTLGLLDENQVATLLQRLNISVRGLRVRSERPNAVILLIGEAAEQGAVLAEVIAETIMGSADRVLSQDLSTLTHSADVSRIVGSPPGYVGYGERLPLHQLKQAPVSVLHLERVDACHDQVRNLLADILAKGVFTDATGQCFRLRETVVLLSARGEPDGRSREIGFDPHTRAAPDPRKCAVQAVGEAIVRLADLICTQVVIGRPGREKWLGNKLLPYLLAGFAHSGLSVSWGEDILRWAVEATAEEKSPWVWAQILEDGIAPLLVKYAAECGATEQVALSLVCEAGRPAIREQGK